MIFRRGTAGKARTLDSYRLPEAVTVCRKLKIRAEKCYKRLLFIA